MRIKILSLLFLSFFYINAQQNQGIIGANNWLNGWTSFRPKTVDYPDANIILRGDIKENTTLLSRNTYLIIGTVHVLPNVILTIEPGTILRGDFDTNGTITVVKGAKINALGTDLEPIVFTSNKSTSERKPGDWGGIILMGDAPINRPGGQTSSIYEANSLINTFGGTNEDSDSGILKYVRIEFAGKKMDQKTSLNGLTLAGVGNKTVIDFVQISYSSDDSFEVVGGTIDFNNVISYRASDDDFDYSMGTQSTIFNGMAIRNPYWCDNTRSRCFEIDSYDKIENCDITKKKTSIKLNNVSLINEEENNLGLIKEAISLKSDSFVTINNCLVAGFSSFIAFDDKYLEKENFKKISIINTRLDSCKELFTNELLVKDESSSEWFLNNNKAIWVTSFGVNNLFKNIDTKKRPDFRLK